MTSPDSSFERSQPSPGRRWSLALRLTLHLVILLLISVAVVGAVLNVALVDSIHREEDQFLNNKARILTRQFEQQPRSIDDMKEEAEEDFAPHEYAQVYARVLDEKGDTIAESPTMGTMLPASVFPPPWVLTSRASRGVEYRSPAGRQFRFMSIRTGGGAGGTLQVALDETSSQRMLARYRRQLALMAAGALACAFVVGYVMARRALRPLGAVAALIQRIQPSALTQRIDRKGLPTELDDVAARLNGMLDRLEDSFTRLSQVSVDLAHELRTPLSNLMGLMENAVEGARSPHDYREVIASSLEECVRLNRMIDGLLFIARADDPRTQIHRERVDVRAVLGHLTDMYQVLALDQKLRLSLECPQEMHAQLDKSLLQRAIDNLVANAMAHTPAGGDVIVRASQAADAAIIEVCDNGQGIAADQLPKVFDRLYRGTVIEEAGKTRGVGLGLSIVRGIMSLHAGQVALDSTPGKGTSVRLIFPAKTLALPS